MFEMEKKLLRLHEGESLHPYRCTSGKLTIGVGRNLEDRGITKQESAYLLDNDIRHTDTLLRKHLSFYPDLCTPRQAVLIDMAFNLGIAGLLSFKRTLEYIRFAEYEKAAVEMLDSVWANQVGERARRLAWMMDTGRWPDVLGDASMGSIYD